MLRVTHSRQTESGPLEHFPIGFEQFPEHSRAEVALEWRGDLTAVGRLLASSSRTDFRSSVHLYARVAAIHLVHVMFLVFALSLKKQTERELQLEYLS